MPDLEFREKVLVMLTGIDSKLTNVCTRIDKVEIALFGADQKDGVVHDLQSLQATVSYWNKLVTLLTIVVTGVASYLGYTKWGGTK